METCKRICSDCPFSKKSANGWLGPYETPEELHRIVMSERPFPCHKKQDKDLINGEAGSKRYPLCRGALAYMKKCAKLPHNPELREAMDQITQEDKEKVMNLPEFMEHHTLEFEEA